MKCAKQVTTGIEWVRSTSRLLQAHKPQELRISLRQICFDARSTVAGLGCLAHAAWLGPATQSVWIRNRTRHSERRVGLPAAMAATGETDLSDEELDLTNNPLPTLADVELKPTLKAS